MRQFEMKKSITIKPIGIINTPYKEPKGMPIQGKFKRGVYRHCQSIA